MNMQDKVKLIVDLHDLDSIRKGFITKEERYMFNAADAFIYVSEPIRTITNDLHSVNKPNIVLYNYPTTSMVKSIEIDWDMAKNRKGLVYEGGINPIGDTKEIAEMNTIFRYRNLFPLFQKLIEMGNEVHAFAGNSDAYITGQHTGVVLYPPTQFDEMIKAISKFKYNLVIFNNEDKQQDQVNYTTANKQWDGLCAGLPSLTCYCDEIQKYTVKHNIGWSFNNIQDIGNCQQLEDDYLNKIESIKRKRNELIFARQIWKLENLYAKVLGLEMKGIPDDLKAQSIFEYGEKETLSLLP